MLPARLDAMAAELDAASPADLEPLRGPSWPGVAPARPAAGRGAARSAGSAPSPTTGARRCLSSATAAARRRRRADGRRRWPWPPPGARSAASPRRAARSPRQSPPEDLHDLRKRCKELRYLLEFFDPLHDPVALPQGRRRPEAAAGLPRRVPGQRGAARRDQHVRRRDAGRTRRAPAATLLAMGGIAAELARSQVAGPGGVRGPVRPVRRARQPGAGPRLLEGRS